MQTDLWNYCLNLYAQPGVEQACLTLQSRGQDVCLLLCAAWLEQRGVGWDDARQAQLSACAEPWQREVVQPLRHLRTQWREAAAQDETLAGLRGQIKSLELEAERTLLWRLASLIQEWPSTQSQRPCNWLQRMASEACPPDCDALQTLRAVVNRA